MRLSIITINYNNAEGLRKTLASVAAQTYKAIEHIIVDGGSTDGSVDVIKEYENTIKHSVTIDKSTIQVKWISEPDNGIYNAMNKGIEIALGYREVDAFNRSKPCGDKNKGVNRSELVEDKCSEAARPERSGVENKGLEIALCRRGVNADHTSYIIHHTSETHISSANSLYESPCDYIQILNSGDILAAPDVTERMMVALDSLNAQRSTLNENGSPAILYGNMLKSYDGKTIINRDTCGGDMYTPESFLYFYKGTLNHDCAYIRRDLFEKYGLYNEQMKICSDWEWYVRAIVLGGEKPVYTNIDVTIFDMNGVSESRGKNAELIKKERRDYLEKILPPSILHDYDQFSFPILQYQRLKKYHLWGLVYFMERVLFKLEKWHILSK